MSAQVPDDLTPTQKKALGDWCRRKGYHHLLRRGPGGIGDLVELCLDHHRARGNRAKIVDWVAACRTWVRNEQRFALERSSPAIRGSAEMPFDFGERDGEGELGEVLSILKGGKTE